MSTSPKRAALIRKKVGRCGKKLNEGIRYCLKYVSAVEKHYSDLVSKDPEQQKYFKSMHSSPSPLSLSLSLSLYVLATGSGLPMEPSANQCTPVLTA